MPQHTRQGGKATLPADADAGHCARVLRRALHTIECRELGPEDAGKRYGPFADTVDGRVTVFMDEEQLRAHHPDQSELHRLARVVRERGPAVDVFLVPPQPSVVFLDEMAHVVRKAAEPACGLGQAGLRLLYEPSRPLRPVRWTGRGEREAEDGR